MTPKQLLDVANNAYPDGYLANYYDDAGQPMASTGDKLAQFVVQELVETFDPGATDQQQLEKGERVLARAVNDLRRVALGLSRELV